VSATRIAVAIAVLAAGLSSLGCEEQPEFEGCQMNENMIRDCETSCSGEDIQCYQTCIVQDHPQCIDGPCVLFQYRPINQEDPWSSADPFCTQGCNGVACPADSTCLPVLSLKKACTADAECQVVSPWATCEAPRHCATTRKECEVNADCQTGEACTSDSGDDVVKSCTWKVCVPNKYQPAK
jgi:hypothetical protein